MTKNDLVRDFGDFSLYYECRLTGCKVDRYEKWCPNGPMGFLSKMKKHEEKKVKTKPADSLNLSTVYHSGRILVVCYNFISNLITKD